MVVTSPERRSENGQPSATEAVERMIDASQRLIGDRIELAKLEAQEAVTRVVTSTVFLLAAGLFALIGWISLMGAVVLLLRQSMTLEAALALVGGIHIVLGGGAALFGMARSRRQPAAAIRPELATAGGRP
jgi:uncharacterized membrane protein YqjE